MDKRLDDNLCEIFAVLKDSGFVLLASVHFGQRGVERGDHSDRHHLLLPVVTQSKSMIARRSSYYTLASLLLTNGLNISALVIRGLSSLRYSVIFSADSEILAFLVPAEFNFDNSDFVMNISEHL